MNPHLTTARVDARLHERRDAQARRYLDALQRSAVRRALVARANRMPGPVPVRGRVLEPVAADAT